MSISPCVARFRRSGDRWFAFSGQAGTAPIDVLQLVIEAPEFLGMLSPDAPQPRAAMVAPGVQSGRVLVVVDDAGGVQLAACPEPGSGLDAIVGDLLAANGKLWHQKYEALAGPFEESLGVALADWVAKRAGDGWSAETFRAGLGRSLSGGRFPITVVVEGLDGAARESLEYLEHMNLQVRVMGYTSSISGEDELVRPRLLTGEASAPSVQPAEPPPRREHSPRTEAVQARVEAVPLVPSAQSVEPPRTEASQPRAVAAPAAPEPDSPIRSLKPGFLSAATSAPTTREPGPVPASSAAAKKKDPEPPAMAGATAKQKEILNRLAKLDELGLSRRGLAYFLPGAAQKDATEGAIVISFDPNRWPFPKAGEVTVAVSIGPEQLAAYLKITPREVEEFLGSLPRADRKEKKGMLLLRAATVNEATQLVNELKALKDVTIGG